MTARMHEQRTVTKENRRFTRARPVTRGGGGPVSQAAIKPPTGVTPGSPGTFTGGTDLPANFAALVALGALGETVTWTTGQHVILDDASHAHWNGTIWVVGNKP